MVRIGICDDCSSFLHQTKSMIDNWDNKPQNITTEVFENGDAMISAHTANPFDIIFLDIVMPLLNGIEAARELREKDKTVKIVFLTSSVEFAVDSYTVKASNYLLKPVHPTKLFTCLDELISEIQSTSRCITVRGLHATHRIQLSSIEYIEAQGKHILFVLSDGNSVESPEPLYTYEDKLILDDGFFKCHRSYIVNLHCISSFSSKEVILHSGCRIPISRSCQKDFETIYFSVIFGKAGADK